jgi:hypothetical protein
MSSEKDFRKLLSSKALRMKNLYYIRDKGGSKVRFRPNWAQRELKREEHDINLILKARQLGMTTAICMDILDDCLFTPHTAAGIVAHTREDAEDIFSKKIKFAYDSLHPLFKEAVTVSTDNTRELRFSNGSSIRVGTSMRGSTLQRLLVTEFGKICARYPERATEIVTGSLNTIQVGQRVWIESTAEGRSGYFYDYCQKAKALKEAQKHLSPLDFKFFFFPWWQHPDYRMSEEVLIPAPYSEYFDRLENEHNIFLEKEQKFWYVKKAETQGEHMLREFPSTPDESFQASNEGLYYGKIITAIRKKGQIGSVPYTDLLPVETAWDLGYGDSTAIFFFQRNPNGSIRIIDYYENHSESLPFYVQQIKAKPYIYTDHWLPHDVEVHELSSGVSRKETLCRLGLQVRVLPRLPVEDGIDAVRSLLPHCWFDEEKTSLGMKHLESYKKEWDDKLGCYKSRPVHDAASHGADAFRMLALAVRIGGSSTLTKDDIERMRHKYLGY